MNDLISICIPTYNRPDFLSVCISSALAQTYRPLEIIISDDSRGDESAALAARLAESSDVPIRYVHNTPALGQNANVNQLFDMAAGDRLLLIHDDDYLVAGGLDALAACWDADRSPVIAFGKQLMVSDNGTSMEAGTDDMNATYYRTRERAGNLPSMLECALLRQIPNNGYLIRTEACRRIRYRPASEVPCGCDTDFSLRLGLAYDAAGAVFIDTFTTANRYSLSSVSTDTALQSVLMPVDKSRLFETILDLKVAPQIEYARDVALFSLASGAIKGFSLRGLQGRALRTYFSKYYPVRTRLSLRGLYHLALIILPRMNKLQSFRRISRPQPQ